MAKVEYSWGLTAIGFIPVALQYEPIFNTPMAKVEYSWGLTAIGFIPVALQYEDFV
jgi:hypothetical protein